MATIEDAPVFTLDDARASGVRKDQVYDMLAAGEIERIGRGVYLRPDAIDPAFAPLAAATAMHPKATMCLTSALVYHELSDAIPFATDIALPRGTRHPAGFARVAWHSFDVSGWAAEHRHCDWRGGCCLFGGAHHRRLLPSHASRRQ